MIGGFRDKRAELLLAVLCPKGFPTDLLNVARRKLEAIEAASRHDDLRSIPGNRLEALAGDRKDQYSIRINNQFRICFRWMEGNAEDVEIIDCH